MVLSSSYPESSDASAAEPIDVAYSEVREDATEITPEAVEEVEEFMRLLLDLAVVEEKEPLPNKTPPQPSQSLESKIAEEKVTPTSSESEIVGQLVDLLAGEDIQEKQSFSEPFASAGDRAVVPSPSPPKLLTAAPGTQPSPLPESSVDSPAEPTESESVPVPKVEPQSDRAPHKKRSQPQPSAPAAKTGGEDEALGALQNLLFGSNMSGLESKINQIEHQIFDSAKLIELLTPVIIELLDRKVRDSKEEMSRALFPIVDRLIYQRAKEDRAAMSAALATVIPEALAKQIRDAPEEIIQAIAPMMGRAIKQQIELDRNEIAQALAPTMGQAIKQQIELERDSMVDALYPVIGSTVSRYLAEAIQSINDKIASAFTFKGIQRKIRAKIQGVSEGELIFSESMPFRVRAAFLIHKGSGLIIADAQTPTEHCLEADMVAGMLTAIRSFVNDCIVQTGSTSELNEIEYGDSKILLEVAGYCYLAVVIQGEPPRNFIGAIRETLSAIVQKHGDPIEEFDGDPDTIPKDVQSRVEDLIEIVKPNSSEARGFPWAMVGICATVLAAVLIPWGIYHHRQTVNRQLEAETLAALTAIPELSVYNLNATAKGDTLTLKGRVPNELLKSKAGTIARSLAPERQIENAIVAVDLPPDPAIVAAEMERVTALFNQQPGTQIAAQYQIVQPGESLPPTGQVTVTGSIERIANAAKITRAFAAIPGVSKVTNTVKVAAPKVNTRVYFKGGSAAIKPVDARVKIAPIRRELERYPEINLKIVGHSLPSEGASQLARQRAIAVRDLLIQQGIDPTRLVVEGSTTSPSDVEATAPDWMSRCVRFETATPAIPSNSSN